MKTMMSLLFSLFLVQSTMAASLPVAPKPLPSEAWLSLLCRGVVTPVQYDPVIFQDVIRFFVQVDPSKPRPSMKEMSRDPKYRDQFDKMARVCTDKRVQTSKQYVDPGYTWLGWGTEYGYSRLVLGEVLIPTSQSCRSVGQPCARISQCCGYANPITSRNTCDLVTNSCVKSANITDSTSTPASATL